jgi:hypothetical protein
MGLSVNGNRAEDHNTSDAGLNRRRNHGRRSPHVNPLILILQSRGRVFNMQQRSHVNHRFNALHGRTYSRYIRDIAGQRLHIIRPGVCRWGIDGQSADRVTRGTEGLNHKRPDSAGGPCHENGRKTLRYSHFQPHLLK